jgi:hypothetical protein
MRNCVENPWLDLLPGPSWVMAMSTPQLGRWFDFTLDRARPLRTGAEESRWCGRPRQQRRQKQKGPAGLGQGLLFLLPDVDSNHGHGD